MNFHRIFLAAFIAQNCFAMNQQNNQMQNNYIIENNHRSGEQSHGNNNVIQRVISREDHLQGANNLLLFSEQALLEQTNHVLAQSEGYQLLYGFYWNVKKHLDLAIRDNTLERQQIQREELIVNRLEGSINLFKDFARQKSRLAQSEKYEKMLISWLNLRAQFSSYICIVRESSSSLTNPQEKKLQNNISFHVQAMNHLKNDMDSLGKLALQNNRDQEKFTFSVNEQRVFTIGTIEEAIKN